VPEPAAAPDPSGPRALQKVADARPRLMVEDEHHLCPGCGHPVAWRILAQVLEDLAVEKRAIATIGHGCYNAMMPMSDFEILQSLHGRAPATATGLKRVRPGAVVFSIQGDGDMANEGLQEVLHAAGRGEQITSIMLNNGVFGDTGGQMTVTTVLGQRTKTSLDGRDARAHGGPIPVADLVACLPGSAYVARGNVSDRAGIARTRRMLRAAFETQLAGRGFSFVEILTMCPTGWFVPARDGGTYLDGTMAAVYPTGVLKDAER
jgi:2-oxoglutarate/2-oxoacid ferredoxin oxidoreductase subunit beta